MTFSVAGNPVAFRDMKPTDRGFVYMTWLRSLQAITDMPAPKFIAWQKPLVEWAITNGITTIACDPEAPDSIFGWSCREGTTRLPQYTYVMNSLRRHGLATELRKQ